jgi:signal transduction histidine kinase/DNA-binding response OmpR family regulator
MDEIISSLPSEPAVELSETQHKILIIDDNPMNVAILSSYLKGSGYQIFVARTGAVGISRAQTEQPDIVLLDVMMPGLDGFETCRRLKEDARTKDIPVIFMTAMSEIKDKVRGFAAGAVDFVTKPLHHEEVVARVSTHLNIRNLTKDLQAQNIHLTQLSEELRVANDMLFKRNVQLETSSELGQQVTSILELDQLLVQVVGLIQSKFGYYFVSIWLVDEPKERLVYQTGAGSGAVLSGERWQVSLAREVVELVQVCRYGEYRQVEPISPDTNHPFLAELPAARAELALPLRGGVEVLGVLDIISDRPSVFSADDRIGLQTLADQTAIAIRNAQLYEAEQRRRKLAESLEQTGRALTSDLDMRQVPQRILDELAGAVPYERGSVFLKWGDELQSIATRGYPAVKGATDISVAIDQGGVFQRMADSGQPIIVDDVTQDPGWQQLDWLPLNHSWLGVPLITKDRVIGMISLTRNQVGAFSQADAQSGLAIAAHAAIALENAGLFNEVNRFTEQLEQQVAQRTEELNRAYHRLEKLDKTKTDFINVTSHELRTPLSVIKGYSQILSVVPLVKEHAETQKLLEGIIHGVDRLHQIVNTMLDVVKIDTQVVEVGREPTRLLPLLEELKKNLSAALTERQQQLDFIDLAPLPPVEANPDLIAKVLYNLVINAIKYTPDGGRITVRGRVIENPDQPALLELSIEDTGIGIDPEHHEQIFEKFYQTGEVAFHSSGQIKFKGGGPGLGLAIVRGNVEAHHGQVWVESERHDEVTLPGSRFFVQLPLRQP